MDSVVWILIANWSRASDSETGENLCVEIDLHDVCVDNTCNPIYFAAELEQLKRQNVPAPLFSFVEGLCRRDSDEMKKRGHKSTRGMQYEGSTVTTCTNWSKCMCIQRHEWVYAYSYSWKVTGAGAMIGHAWWQGSLEPKWFVVCVLAVNSVKSRLGDCLIRFDARARTTCHDHTVIVDLRPQASDDQAPGSDLEPLVRLHSDLFKSC